MSAAESSLSGKEPAFVPRFQQRTSERAYYEGAFKPNGMDYSSSIQDPEHPAGGSPWSTSPKHARGYNNASATGQSPFGPAGQEGGYQDRPSTSDTATLGPSENGHSQNGQSPYHPQEQQYAQQRNNYDQGLPSPAMDDQRRPEAQRYHSRQQQQQSRPQYKLQCKVTGLERTGKKDPILRFDAHVSNL